MPENLPVVESIKQIEKNNQNQLTENNDTDIE